MIAPRQWSIYFYCIKLNFVKYTIPLCLCFCGRGHIFYARVKESKKQVQFRGTIINRAWELLPVLIFCREG